MKGISLCSGLINSMFVRRASCPGQVDICLTCKWSLWRLKDRDPQVERHNHVSHLDAMAKCHCGSSSPQCRQDVLLPTLLLTLCSHKPCVTTCLHDALLIHIG